MSLPCFCQQVRVGAMLGRLSMVCFGHSVTTRSDIKFSSYVMSHLGADSLYINHFDDDGKLLN